MDPHIKATIHHVASQAFYHWEALDEQICFVPRIDLSGFDVSAWRGYLEEVISCQPHYVWVQKLRERGERGLASMTLAIVKHLELVHRHGGQYLTIFDQAYPTLLRNILDPPHAISILGDARLLGRPMVAVVGSRKASRSSLQEAARIGAFLAAKGYVVVSGGAFGCDAAAHYGAIIGGETPVPTIVVFAGGLHRFYPSHNHWLFKQLLAGGAVFMSERLWWSNCRPFDFPVRNRVISGLSEVVVIVQAHQRSGAMITARLALDQGREVAVWEQADSEIGTEGNAHLIEEGAWKFQSSENLLAYLHQNSGSG